MKKSDLEKDFLRADLRALRLQVDRLRGAISEAVSAPARADEVLRAALEPLRGEHATQYYMHIGPEGRDQRFDSWAVRDLEIDRLHAEGVCGIEITELPARSCMMLPWRPVRRPRARRSK